MKNYVIAGAIALSASISFANQEVNIKKVNKVIKSVVESETTPLINKIVLKFDEKSNLESVAELKTGVVLSAQAKETVWSKAPTTLDLTADFKTLTSDAASTKNKLNLNLGSKTEAVPLYAYIAKEFAESMTEEPIEDANDQAFADLLAEAMQTVRLDQIPAQLEKLIVIIKNELNENPEEGDLEWNALLNSLKVDTKIQNFKTTEVVLKTTTEVAVDFFGAKILISDLALKVSETGLSINGAVAATMPTEQITELLTSVKGFLGMVQDADAETLQELKDMAKSYVEVAESIAKGED